MRVVIVAGLIAVALGAGAIGRPHVAPDFPGATAPQQASQSFPHPISPGDATSHIGQKVTVAGTAWVHEKPGATFLDLGGDYPYQDFTAVIWPEDRGQFGDVAALDGRTVAVSGTVQMYDGTPEIVVRRRNQLLLQ